MSLDAFKDYDVLLLDLDGTVFAGGEPIDGAAEGIGGQPRVFVTNNASRSPVEVAQHLSELGVPTKKEEVRTSAQAACDLAWQLVSGHSDSPTALVIGADSFRRLAAERGFTVVTSADDEPDIVLQGHSPDNGWADLSEGVLAISRGAIHVASNLDTTLPSERGFLVGNGSMVAAVCSATGVTPHSAGKPEPAMFTSAAQSAGAKRPLVVGDRIDTDIAGGINAGMDTLLVLTGVSTHWDTIRTSHRPTHIAANLRDELPVFEAHRVDDSTVSVSSGTGNANVAEELLSAAALAVAAPVAWRLIDAGCAPDAVSIIGQDATASKAISAWRD